VAGVGGPQEERGVLQEDDVNSRPPSNRVTPE